MYTKIIQLLLLEEQLQCLSFCLHHLEVVLFGNHKGVKGNPKGVNRFLDCDVILAMVRKPDFSVFDKNKLPDTCIRFKHMQRGNYRQCTIIFRSFLTYRSVQTVQTQIRLLFECLQQFLRVT